MPKSLVSVMRPVTADAVAVPGLALRMRGGLMVDRLDRRRGQPADIPLGGTLFRLRATAWRLLLQLPRPRHMAGIVVEEEDDLPDLIFLQHLVPDRHRRGPGGAFAGQPRTARGDAPEQVGFLQLSDGSHILEVRRTGIEGGAEMALPVEAVAMAVEAVGIVKPGALADRLRVAVTALGA